MLNEAINYPREREDWVKQVVIGGVVTILGITAFLAVGYLIRVLRGTYEGETEPPAFDEWGELAVSGILAIVIGIVYSLIPLAIFLGLGGLGMATGTEGGAIAGMMTAFAAAGIVGLVFGYVYPAALANFAREESFEDAFAFGTIKEIVLTKEYAVGWLSAFVVSIGASVVTWILSITIVGILAVPFVSFYAYVAAYRLYGQGYADAYDGLGSDETAAGAEVTV